MSIGSSADCDHLGELVGDGDWACKSTQQRFRKVIYMFLPRCWNGAEIHLRLKRHHTDVPKVREKYLKVLPSNHGYDG
jgi:hypothetical protein